MKCEFCGKLAKNENSYRGHRIRCKLNPDKIEMGHRRGATLSVESRKKISEAAKKQHEEGRGSLPPSTLGKITSVETKEKISKALMGNRNGNHRGDRQSFYKSVRMDSSWEVKTAEYLDRQGLDWKYSERGYELSDGRVYFPDFFVYNSDGNLEYLIEVKGFFRDENRKKFELFLENYPDIKIELWMKEDLKARNIL